MLRFKEETGREVSDMKPTDISDLICFMWCCCASACNADHVEFDMDLHSFADSLEGNELQEFASGLIGTDGGEQKKSPESLKK